ncbi:MAG: TIGR03564 family F420-dependent LLM class oxidoreductase [Acidobacteria bacterium]|nr:TIGR03564 family F420-dependent LLM class oxidoreductase [Acidobacteriota bacterium]
MRIAIGLETDGSIDQVLERAHHLHDLGFRSVWSSQIFGPDTLTAIAVVGRELRDMDFGTAVVPIQPRHPAMLGAQARTVQDAIGGHLSLGIGLSHQVVVEGMWGISFDKPATYMKEYVAALAPILRGEAANVHGEKVTAVTMGTVGPRQVTPPSLILAALGPVMLELAGREADGTCLWMTGVSTIRTHVAPRIRAAADAAGRPAPRVIAALPIAVTNDVAAARARINETLAVYGTLPSYQAMLEKEGAKEVADVAVLGTTSEVRDKLAELAEAGATEFSAAIIGTDAERDATIELLLELNKG